MQVCREEITHNHRSNTALTQLKHSSNTTLTQLKHSSNTSKRFKWCLSECPLESKNLISWENKWMVIRNIQTFEHKTFYSICTVQLWTSTLSQVTSPLRILTQTRVDKTWWWIRINQTTSKPLSVHYRSAMFKIVTR